MACASPSQGILSRIKEHHLTCDICQCPYLLPKALPCLHTFCTQCLQDYIYSRCYDAAMQFPCPLCRVSVDLPKEGADSFPDNHLIVTLMDTIIDDRRSPVNIPTDEFITQPTAPDSPPPPPYESDPQEQLALYPDLTNMMYDLECSELDEKKKNKKKQPPPKPPRQTPPARPTTRPHPTARTETTTRPHPTARTETTTHPHPTARTETPNHHPTTQPRHTARTETPRTTTQPRSIARSETPTTLPTRPALVQRKLVLSGETYQVPVMHDVGGADTVFGRYGDGLTEFHKPVGLAVTPEGYIIVGDQRDNRVFIFEKNGQVKRMFTCQGELHDMTTNDRGLIYIANRQAKRSLVTCYNNRGHTVAKFGNFFSFEKPHGVAVTQDNHMVITSVETHQVYMLNEYGKMIHKFTGKGKDGRRLHYPYHVAITSKNRIVVSDHGNDCIKVFDSAGKCKEQFGKPGGKPGQLNGPRGVCVDRKDNIIVADSRNDRIQVFSCKGQLVQVPVQLSRDVGACPVNVAVGHDFLAVLLCGGSFAQVRVYPYKV